MKRIGWYLLFSFGMTWALWIGCYVFNAPQTVVLVAGMAAMWMPALSVWITHKITGGERVLGASWRPKLKGHVKWYLLAWFAPAVLTVAGGALYFVIFPQQFDGTLSAIRGQLEALGGQGADIPAGMLVAAQAMSALTFGPLINMLFAVGEEIGWRGFLFPALSKRYSNIKAHILTGIIWGLWHTPYNMMGHNYGTAYAGYPWLGIIAMCVFTFAAGVFLSWLTEKTGSIWPAAIGHGAINAAAGLPLLFIKDISYNQALGPAISGLIAALPSLACAILVLIKQARPQKADAV